MISCPFLNRLPCQCLLILIALLTTAPVVARETLDELIFSHSFGYRGSLPGGFNDPFTVAVDSQDRIIIADQSNHRIQVCNDTGECTAFGAWGDAPGQFNYPTGVAIDSEDHIIVADYGNGRVQICSAGGVCDYLKDELGQPRQFEYPLDVAVGSDNRIIITHYKRNIYHICSAGAECASFEGFGSSFVTVDREDRILFMDDDRVWFCDYQGHCEWAFGKSGNNPGEFYSAKDLTTDSDGRIFIADQGNRRIQICSDTGDCHTFEIHRSGWGQIMWWPSGVALTADGRVIVSDREGNRIHVYDLIEIDKPAIPINIALNDAWYDPATPGQGFFINVFDEVEQKMFVTWFTYDIKRPDESVPSNFGDAGHRWLTAQGIYHTYTATLTLYNTTGPVFLDNAVDPETTFFGEMVIRFSDCARGTIFYNMPSINRSGEIPIYRLTNDSRNFCEQLLNSE